jgi:L-ascorbate metabolism protein UlaG (beta-lactamase superfamily)
MLLQLSLVCDESVTMRFPMFLLQCAFFAASASVSAHCASHDAPPPPAAVQNPPTGRAASTPAQHADTYQLTLPDEPGAVDAASTIQFIGTATVLIRYHGLVILTDPNFLHRGEQVYLGYGLHSQRLTEPALMLDQLPPIDLVLLSHMHEDHFDRRVQENLRRDVPIVTTRESAERLRRLGFTRRFPLARWDSLEVRKGQTLLRISAMPGRHGGPVSSLLLPPVMGSMLDFRHGADAPSYRLYISGDTLVFDAIADIPRLFPDIDLALLHLGGTRVFGLIKVTMDGDDGVRMLKIIAPSHAIPIHYDDYDVFKSPLSAFTAAVKTAGLSSTVVYLKRGETYPLVKAKPSVAH